MRDILASFYVTLDGVVEAPQDWHFPYVDDEMQQAVGAQMARGDTMLLGRRTYEEFEGFWADKGSDVPFADHINQTPKFVVSTTLKDATWQNSTLVATDVAGQLQQLKEGPGGGISIAGSPTLVRSLLPLGLVDELHLMIHPLVLGAGKRLFEPGGDRSALKLEASKTFASGVLSLAYSVLPA